jgi:DmsE family decaheme c-type cytochrome
MRPKLAIMFIALTTFLFNTGALSAAQNDKQAKAHAEFSRKGADTCLQCHDEESSKTVMDIFKTAHGAQSSFKSGQCEACHGPIGDHGKKRIRKGEQRQTMLDFGGKQKGFSLAKINAVCSSCHSDGQMGHFKGSVHDNGEVACTSCHSIHVKSDPIKKPAGQLKQCGSCHTSAKTQHSRFSNHPIANGKMACTDCHNPHDSNHDKLLKSGSVNETCHQCHAGKRGPFLWEHEPVSEDCTTCHNPHGSNQPALLKQRAPFLCQQCHGTGEHPGFMPTNSGIWGVTPSAFVIGKSCLNCHSRIHGSNHPSGEKLQR